MHSDTFAQADNYARRHFCTKGQFCTGWILLKLFFNLNFFLISQIIHVFTVTVNANPYSWLVAFFYNKFYEFFFIFIITVTPNPYPQLVASISIYLLVFFLFYFFAKTTLRAKLSLMQNCLLSILSPCAIYMFICLIISHQMLKALKQP